MKLSVAYAAGRDNFWQELDLKAPITVDQAIQQSRLAATFSELDLSDLKVGIFGKVCPKNTQLEEGDRVEVYQPIIAKESDDDDDDDF
ncbi:MAG: putative ubiquitin-RnfH superfamily antitoxin RatB of RatAB toxin-antitoxin module [Psychromonas sp.]|jgi:putative ubiquitin-RnfH superfamily antitoxin RatB of RatAB toxin-antitoxin module|uniref:RnfH family protein n=1 Tax=Psychromonas sp. TaxID=1884585 RepID=UPI0039E2C413